MYNSKNPDNLFKQSELAELEAKLGLLRKQKEKEVDFYRNLHSDYPHKESETEIARRNLELRIEKRDLRRTFDGHIEAIMVKNTIYVQENMQLKA